MILANGGVFDGRHRGEERYWITFARPTESRPHLPRHTGNTLAADVGVSLRKLMARMGHDNERPHSSISTGPTRRTLLKSSRASGETFSM
ncbi:hypothetical protein Airi02_061110 [Actinoallomurus iriomotensis]|uniref:Uncharacterized protein n=1 Tax=Actinoallomurus iriomotensis TaxID=478107 RepID=A0A9W6S9J1_9ACTN|nr:hypothetical protein Airi02_061110 [Actinoallomurus iriomotensis]